MLAIFWVQSWWLGNTPENQDEPSRKNGHIFDTFFWTDRFFRLLTFTSLWKRWNRQISHKKSPKSPVEGFLPRLFKSKIIWDSNHVLRNGQIIESLTLNFIFQWWKGTFTSHSKIAKKNPENTSHYGSCFFLMLPFNFSLKRATEGPFKKKL